MQFITKDEIKDFTQDDNFDIVMVDLDLNYDSLYLLSMDILKEYELIGKDNTSTYCGIGLQYADDSNPLYDAINFVTKDGLKYTKLNKIGKLFEIVHNEFSSFKLSRGRLLLTKPGHCGNTHTDETKAYRIHFPIFTNKHCWMKFGNKKYHMPVSNFAYLANTKKPHSFVNYGDTDRLHLVYTIQIL